MKHLTTPLATLAVSALMAGSAMAITVDDTGEAGGASAPSTFVIGDALDVEFRWASSPASAFVEFTTTKAFNVYFTDYLPRGGNEVSGFVLKKVGGPTLTDDTNFCSGTDTIAEIRGDCDLITGPDATPSHTTFYRPDNNTPVFAGVDAGTYRIGIKESGSPEQAQAGFQITEVPLPAGGLLLLGGLGAFGALRRRKGA